MAAPEEELFDRAVAGDTLALRALLERYGPQVRSRISGKISKRWQAVLDVDDVMQVTYLQACLHIDQLVERTPAAFAAWLTRIAENNLRDAISELERPKRPPPEKQVQTPAGLLRLAHGRLDQFTLAVGRSVAALLALVHAKSSERHLQAVSPVRS